MQNCSALIDPADFPKHGSIRVNINGGDTAEDLYERFGSFVSLKINEDDPYPNYDGNNMYSLRYNSSFGRTNSGIWIEKFSGKDFYQIIDVDSDISTLINTRSIPEPDCTIRTTLVLLRLNSKLYGPFEYDTTEGTMKLRGIKDYAQVFEIIVRWFRYGEYSLEKERLILQVKTLDKLFEYYCLLRLLKLLADNGYQKANVKEPVFKFDYVSADEH